MCPATEVALHRWESVGGALPTPEVRLMDEVVPSREFIHRLVGWAGRLAVGSGESNMCSRNVVRRGCLI
jgi:hypothetical protein